MALFKVTAKKSGSFSNGVKIEKGMSVEVVHNNNPLTTSQGREKVITAVKNKYGFDLKQFASSTYFSSEKIN